MRQSVPLQPGEQQVAQPAVARVALVEPDLLGESECNAYGFYPPASFWAQRSADADTLVDALRSAGL